MVFALRVFCLSLSLAMSATGLQSCRKSEDTTNLRYTSNATAKAITTKLHSEVANGAIVRQAQQKLTVQLDLDPFTVRKYELNSFDWELDFYQLDGNNEVVFETKNIQEYSRDIEVHLVEGLNVFVAEGKILKEGAQDSVRTTFEIALDTTAPQISLAGFAKVDKHTGKAEVHAQLISRSGDLHSCREFLLENRAKKTLLKKITINPEIERAHQELARQYKPIDAYRKQEDGGIGDEPRQYLAPVVEGLPGDQVKDFFLFATCQDHQENLVQVELPVETIEEAFEFDLTVTLPRGSQDLTQHKYHSQPALANSKAAAPKNEESSYPYFIKQGALQIAAKDASNHAHTQLHDFVLFLPSNPKHKPAPLQIKFEMFAERKPLAPLFYERNAAFLQYVISRTPLQEISDFDKWMQEDLKSQRKTILQTGKVAHTIQVPLPEGESGPQTLHVSVIWTSPLAQGTRQFYQSPNSPILQNLPIHLYPDSEGPKLSRKTPAQFALPGQRKAGTHEKGAAGLSFVEVEYHYRYTGAPLHMVSVEYFHADDTRGNALNKQTEARARGERREAGPITLLNIAPQDYVWYPLPHLEEKITAPPHTFAWIKDLHLIEGETQMIAGKREHQGKVRFKVGVGQQIPPIFRVRVVAEDISGNRSYSPASGYLFRPGTGFEQDEIFANAIVDRCRSVAGRSYFTARLLSHASCRQDGRTLVPLQLLNLGAATIAAERSDSMPTTGMTADTSFIRYLVEHNTELVTQEYRLTQAALTPSGNGPNAGRVEFIEVNPQWFEHAKEVRLIFDSDQDVDDIESVLKGQLRIYGNNSIQNSCYQPRSTEQLKAFPVLILQSDRNYIRNKKAEDASTPDPIEMLISPFSCD
ncbi:MAG: hypothetical protein OXT67_06210 [Zetaproteobacteria bacterium]|nr:hypothetical protein [Zetaproteobacteria bacterium]